MRRKGEIHSLYKSSSSRSRIYKYGVDAPVGGVRTVRHETLHQPQNLLRVPTKRRETSLGVHKKKHFVLKRL